MRTKTLLLTAALTAAGVATSMAQVYSVNMVGYINQSIPQGFSMIANQLNASPDNKVTTLLPAPPASTSVFKFNAAQHPDEKFYSRVGLARGYTAMGDKTNAIKNWELALQNVPEEQKPNLPIYQKALDDLKKE